MEEYTLAFATGSCFQVSEKLPVSYVLATYQLEGSYQVGYDFACRIYVIILLLIVLLNFYAFCGSQELFEVVEQERSLRATPSRNAAIFHHPAFGDFELQHVSYQSLCVYLIVLHLKHIINLLFVYVSTTFFFFYNCAVTHDSK